jgi:hypothetical protein
MSRKRSDAGYLVVLRNDSRVYTALGCRDHGEGSPYPFHRRIKTNAAVSPPPRKSSVRRRSGPGRSSMAPKAYPAAMTPIHGTMG